MVINYYHVIKYVLICRIFNTLYLPFHHNLEDIQSQTASVTCGVPQGSNLGPLFFLLYVNDITHVSKFKTTLFADDTVLSFSAKISH